jgi:hypothetical protein
MEALGGSPLLQQRKLDFTPAEENSISKSPLAVGLNVTLHSSIP